MSTRDIYPVLITRDAAATIERTLESLAAFPEVVVYDNGSTDDTIERCRRFANVRVVTGEFFGYGKTKNHAVSLARGDWVLSIDADEYVGKTIAMKYRVEALIGEGGMGKVYRARQLALDKVVVLKVLRQTLLSDERTVARFQREAKAASRLNHPNSISVLDFGQAEDGALYIAQAGTGGFAGWLGHDGGVQVSVRR